MDHASRTPTTGSAHWFFPRQLTLRNVWGARRGGEGRGQFCGPCFTYTYNWLSAHWFFSAPTDAKKSTMGRSEGRGESSFVDQNPDPIGSETFSPIPYVKKIYSGYG